MFLDDIDAVGLDAEIVTQRTMKRAPRFDVSPTSIITSGIMNETARAAAIDAGRQLASVLTYNPFSNRATSWAEKNSARLVVEIKESTRDGLRSIITEAKRINMHPGNPKLRALIKESVGLTSRQVTSVGNYWLKMAESGVDQQTMSRNSKKYAERLHNLRAETIARHELLQATEEGITQGWQTAIDDGLVESSRMSQEWSTSQDERVSERICRPMHGQIRPFGESFMTGEGELILGPPAHVMCRCVRLITVSTTSVESITPTKPVDRVRGKTAPTRSLKPPFKRDEID